MIILQKPKRFTRLQKKLLILYVCTMKRNLINKKKNMNKR